MAQAQHANLPGPGAISMTDDTIHTCSYECERPGCIRAQRDELVAKVEALSTDLRAMRAELERALEARQLISDDLATAEGRADKLAEALRLAEEHINAITPEWYNSGQRVLAEIRTALEQENRNDRRG